MTTSAGRIPGYRPPSVILWHKTLSGLCQSIPQFAEFLDHSSIQRFPDGSVYVEDEEDVYALYANLSTPLRRPRIPVREHGHFRSLKCFGATQERSFLLMTTEEYFQAIGGEQRISIGPVPCMDAPWPGEYRPDRLTVSVRFWGGWEKADRPLFYKAMIAWADSVALRGQFGEGSAYLFPESFLFDRRGAKFEIDVRESGQNTVNWLTLSILNFSETGNLPCAMSYGNPDERGTE